MANELRTEVEQVKEQEEVKRALKQTGTVKPEEKPKAKTKDDETDPSLSRDTCADAR
jgi:hypothetical protein